MRHLKQIQVLQVKALTEIEEVRQKAAEVILMVHQEADHPQAEVIHHLLKREAEENKFISIK